MTSKQVDELVRRHAAFVSQALQQAKSYVAKRLRVSRKPSWREAVNHIVRKFPHAALGDVENALEPLAASLGRRSRQVASTIPVLRCTLRRARRPITRPVMKVGGSPVLVARSEWPRCRHCRREMDFLAQVPLRQPLELARRFDLAHVFMCEGYDNGLGERPKTCGRSWAVCLAKRSAKPTVVERKTKLPEFAITFRSSREPQVDTSSEEADEDACARVFDGTKLGGVPAWRQSAEHPKCPACKGPMRFVAQLHSEVDGPLPASMTRWSRLYLLNFGDAGTGYLFLCSRECGTRGAKLVIQW